MSIVLIRGDGNYQPWLDAFDAIAPDLPIFTPDTVPDREAIKIAWAWRAPKGSYVAYPNLEVIGSLGAGVDHLFADASLPRNVVLTRVVDPHLTGDMAEFVLTLALNSIKNINTYHHFQHGKDWKMLSYKRCSQVNVGILGLGTLGQATGKLLTKVGFRVSGWAQSEKDIEGVDSYGSSGLNDFLRNTAILVCLLPLTLETRHILNTNLFAKMPKGAHLINVGRGGHLNENDLLQALNSGQLSGASLDVVSEEPLPKPHPFWEHPKIYLTPHIAGVSEPSSVVGQLVENYERFMRGEPLLHVVSNQKQY